MNKPAEEVFQFVVEQAAEVLPCRRIKIYRALAEVIGNSESAEKLLEIADEIEASEHAQAELRLRWRVISPANSRKRAG